MKERIGESSRTLSKREMEVIDLIIGGVTRNEDIAQRLGIAKGTITAHVSNMFDLVEDWTGVRPTSKRELLALIETKVGDKIIPDDEWRDHI